MSDITNLTIATAIDGLESAEATIATQRALIAELVGALEGFAFAKFTDGSPCFCINPPRTPDFAVHGPRCTQARAALAKVAKEAPDADTD